MCIVIVGCNLGVISALLEMNRRNQHRRRIHKQISVQTNCSVTDAALDLPPIGNNNGPLQRDGTSFVRQISAPMGSSTEDVIGEPFDFNQTHRDSAYSASSSSASAARRRQTLEEIKFARLMVILSIFYVICWIPQLVNISKMLDSFFANDGGPFPILFFMSPFLKRLDLGSFPVIQRI